MSDSIRELVILGSGPAGLTSAVYTARANLSPLLINGPMPGGQLTTTTDVENYPGFSDGIMGPALMEEMRKQAEKFGTEIVYGMVDKVEVDNGIVSLSVDGEKIKTKALIISTGASPRLLGLPDEATMMGYGLSTCATCDGAFFRDKEIVVVGGGDSACEEAIFLTKFGSRVRVLHRRTEFRASKIMAERVINHDKIEVLWNTELVGLKGTQDSGIQGGVIKNTETGEETEIECSAIFYAIGHTPNSSLFENKLELDENGYIITAADSARTTVPGVFACGDVQDHTYRQAITAAGTGCMAAIEAERYLSGL